MNVELSLIQRLLTDKGEAATKILESPYGSKILAGSEVYFDDIQKHYKNYGAYPTVGTFLATNPSVILPLSPEPVEFYIDKAVEAFKYNIYLGTQEKMTEELGNRNIEAISELIATDLKEIQKSAAKSKDVMYVETLEDRINQYNTLRDGVPIKGFSTGWNWLDEATGGFLEEDFVILFGPAKTFKTHILISWALNGWKKSNKKIGIVSKEMNHRAIARRADGKLGGVSADALRRGTLTDEEFEAFTEKLKVESNTHAFQEVPNDIVLIDLSEADGKTEIDYIGLKIEEHNLDVLFIDGIYLFTAPGESDWIRQTNVSRSIKAMNLKYKIPIIATTQAAKTGKKMLTSDNVAYTNALKQDCSYLFGIDRVYDKISEELTSSIQVSALSSRETDAFSGIMELQPDLTFKQQSINLDGSFDLMGGGE